MKNGLSCNSWNVVLKAVDQELASTIIELALEECVLEIAYGGGVAQLAKRRGGTTHPVQPLLGT